MSCIDARAHRRYRSADPLDVPVDDELFLVDAESAEGFRLNPSATDLWHRLRGGASPAEIATAISAETTATHDEVLAATIDFADRLVDLGLLRPGD